MNTALLKLVCLITAAAISNPVILHELLKITESLN